MMMGILPIDIIAGAVMSYVILQVVLVEISDRKSRVDIPRCQELTHGACKFEYNGRTGVKRVVVEAIHDDPFSEIDTRVAAINTEIGISEAQVTWRRAMLVSAICTLCMYIYMRMTINQLHERVDDRNRVYGILFMMFILVWTMSYSMDTYIFYHDTNHHNSSIRGNMEAIITALNKLKK
jgi:hypothetical protein